MRLLSRIEGDRKSGAIWVVLFRQSTKEGPINAVYSSSKKRNTLNLLTQTFRESIKSVLP
jgi:hypothetical protein